MKKILKILIFFTLFPSIVLATNGEGGNTPTCGNGICESGENCSNCSIDCCPTTGDFMGKVESLVGILIKIVAVISAIELVYAGFLLATAQGDPEKAKTAKSILIYATLGIGVAAMAWALVQFVVSVLGG